MPAYYNEIDPFAAAWLRELIKANLIAPGEVDERDTWDVVPGELVEFSQWHFCAGIGTWSYALRCAGWPDDRQVFTISLPCQPFSAAGKGAGLADERGQLAEAFFWIAGVLRPDTIIGEQVEAAIKHDWFDVVATHLEREGYAVGAVGFPACSTGAPHIRQRLYWCADKLANSNERRCGTAGERRRVSQELFGGRSDFTLSVEKRSPTRRVADAEHAERRQKGYRRDDSDAEENGWQQGASVLGKRGNSGVLGDSGGERLQEQRSVRGTSCGQVGAVQGKASERTGTPTNGFWRNAEWIPCRDGKARPVEPGTFPLAHGAPARVGRLRGYGNAIVAPAAEAFIRAYLET
jgi:DNA (cytosine-5)-methyltransferase 1